MTKTGKYKGDETEDSKTIGERYQCLSVILYVGHHSIPIWSSIPVKFVLSGVVIVMNSNMCKPWHFLTCSVYAEYLV